MAKSKSKYKALVIVESPAKARKISGYLGSDYKVLASMGHVRDLPSGAAEIPKAVKSEPWSRIGINVDSEFEPLYIIPKGKKKIVDELKESLKQSDELILATDEDREGESIGWHLVELLKPTVPTSRMVFGEITKKAILEALDQKRDLDKNLVEAQETRRVLDRLFGYTLSPLLWKKVAPKLSAGRVQSVAVKVLVEREKERARFVSAEYWDLKAGLETVSGGNFDAVLHSVDGKRVASGRDFDENTGKLKPGADVVLLNSEQASALRDRIEKTDWNVASVESREQTRRPYPPFTTSTLQQESNRKLNMTARATMQAAQRLYEEGHITYMRTDSVTLSSEAINAARASVDARYGENFLSPSPRTFTNKSKGAQEAHEAIRPAGTEMKTAEEIGLTGQEARLYSLIWKRTMATQMADAKLLFQTVTIAADEAEFRATGRHVVFPGFFRAYVEGVDDPEAALDDQESALPPLTEAEKLQLEKLESLSHATKPPARFTEATLVGQLESEGIGRPSTYASIIGTIQDRGYVVKQGSQLVPTFTAMAVTQLLQNHFSHLVDYKFTALMEQQLDEVASGEAERLPYLRRFYHGDEGLDQQVKSKEEGIDPRVACTLHLEHVTPDIRVGKFGPYVQVEQEDGESVSVSLPAEIAPADVTNELTTKLIERKKAGPQSLGMHPEEGLPVFVKQGPFGTYLQLGDDPKDEDSPKPKRCSVPKHVEPEDITLDIALQYLALPRRLGQHPETGNVVNSGLGKFGPYVTSRKDGRQVYKSLTKDHDVLTVNLETAVQLLADVKPRGPAPPIRELGKHPDDEEIIGVYEGRYGPYVKHGKIYASLPKDLEIESVTLERALDLIAVKAAQT
ncbi:MAG: type I DNA topoisomerase, partial [Rhodopirellula sp.]|nr:type I DNA topoisomerase [Rhodopirellula sp.]